LAATRHRHRQLEAAGSDHVIVIVRNLQRDKAGVNDRVEDALIDEFDIEWEGDALRHVGPASLRQCLFGGNGDVA
jgi:hypothetical protein